MSQNFGTITEGFSQVLIMPQGESGAFLFEVPPGQGFDRLERLGTLIQCDSFSAPAIYPVSRVFKLFGGGLIAGADPSVTAWASGSELWVRLFVPSLQYLAFGS